MVYDVAADHGQPRRLTDQVLERRRQRVVLEHREVGRPARREPAALALGEGHRGAAAGERGQRLGAREPLARPTTTFVRMSRRATTAANATQGSAGLLSVAMP